jgi:hypothetical protein
MMESSKVRGVLQKRIEEQKLVNPDYYSAYMMGNFSEKLVEAIVTLSKYSVKEAESLLR